MSNMIGLDPLRTDLVLKLDLAGATYEIETQCNREQDET